MSDHWLYRCFDADGDLLYVGITSCGMKRFRQHDDDKPWWREVVDIKLEHFDSRAAMEEAEIAAIRRECPEHNSTYRVRISGAYQNVVPFPRDRAWAWRNDEREDAPTTN